MNGRRLSRLLMLLMCTGFLFAGPNTVLPGARADAGARADDPPPKKKKRKKNRKKKAGIKTVDTSKVRPNKKLERRVQEALGEGFKLKRTAHFSIFYDTSDEDVAVFSYAVEKTYNSCVKYNVKLGIDTHQPKRKLISHFFDELENYSAYSEKIGSGKRGAGTLGFFLPSTNHTYFYNIRNTPAFKKRRQEAEKKLADLGAKMQGGRLNASEKKSIRNQMKQARRVINRTNGMGGGMTEATLQHEVAHQVLWNVGFHNPRHFLTNPRWFAEGTAMVFEPISDGKAANFGQVNRERLKQYQALVKAGRLIPLRNFISSDRPFRRPDVGGLAYPQSWALVHYLNRVKRKQLKEYVEILLERPKDYAPTPKQEIADFEKAFGKLDQKWVKKWHRWMKNVR